MQVLQLRQVPNLRRDGAVGQVVVRQGPKTSEHVWPDLSRQGLSQRTLREGAAGRCNAMSAGYI